MIKIYSKLLSGGCLLRDISSRSCYIAESTTDVGKGNYMPALEYDNRTDMVYAVFNTPRYAHVLPSGFIPCIYQYLFHLHSSHVILFTES